MKQKLTVFLLMIYCCLLFAGIHSVSAATSGTCGTNLTWTLDDAGTLTISGTGDMTSWDHYSSVPWYSNRSKVKKVVIGNGVTSIGEGVFYGCDSLTSITIPDNVTSIGRSAFRECKSLIGVTIGDSVASIGEYAFSDCDSLTSITIPDSVSSIGYDAFYLCKSLTSVTIGDSVTYIGSEAFDGCYSLTDVYYHGTEEEWNAIYISYDNTRLTGATRHYFVSVTLLNPDGTEYAKIMQPMGTALDMEKIPATEGASISVYKDSDMTQEYDLDTIINEDTVLYVKVIVASGTCGDNLTWTLNDAGTLTISGTGDMYSWDYDSSAPWYSHRSKVKKVVIENGVTTIGDCAFYYCYSLTSITIPDSVTSIGEYAFYRCTRLTSVTIGNGVTSIGWWAFYRCNSLTSVTIGDSVTSIGYSAFEDCASLTSITIPDSVSTISDRAFYNCTSLTSVTIGNGVTSIGWGAFEYCASLTSITIPDSVSTISDRAFDSCTSLTSVTIPDSVTTIGDYVFYDCLSLTNIIVDENNANFSSIDGNLFDKNHTTLIQYATGKTETAYVIPDSVTGIVYDAFRNCTSLTSVTIPDSVTTIGECAFHNCTSLTDVYYHGTAEEWNAISIGYGNTPLQSATRHYVVSVTLLNPDGTEYAKWTQLPGTALDVDKIPAIDGSSISVYKDSAMTQEYDFDAIINEDTMLYVKVMGGIKAKLSEDKKQLEVQPFGISEGSKILVAFYQDGKFQQVQPETYKGEALFFPVNQAYTDIKIMAWQNFDTLKSLCVPEEIPIQ